MNLREQIESFLSHRRTVDEGEARSRRLQAETEANIRVARAEAEAARRAAKMAEEARRAAEEATSKAIAEAKVKGRKKGRKDGRAARSGKRVHCTTLFVDLWSVCRAYLRADKAVYYILCTVYILCTRLTHSLGTHM